MYQHIGYASSPMGMYQQIGHASSPMSICEVTSYRMRETCKTSKGFKRSAAR